MRDQSTAIADRTPAVTCNHPDDVAEVQPQPGYRIHVRFYDGTAGIVDLSTLITSPNAGVFASLSDKDVFTQAAVVMGAVTWPNGLDLAPDAMYEALSKNPEWHVAA